MSAVALSPDGCRARQERLRGVLAGQGVEAALLTDPRHIYYFSGYWRKGRVLTPAALFLRPDGESLLVAPSPPEGPIVADSFHSYTADRIGTLVEDAGAELLRVLQPHLTGVHTLGADAAPHSWVAGIPAVRTISPQIRALRRGKDPDEVVMLEAGIAGCNAAYRRAREVLRPGVTEVELYAEMLAAATKAAGEPVVEFGNDFQIGALGSLPRNRPAQQGETAILDVAVVYRGYSSDLCRTFVVGGKPSESQSAAHERVMEALQYVEEAVRPGASCKQVYREVHAMLDGYRGWRFPHHLGHGIGLSAHEAPRLNPHWEDTFQIGDIFTAEPGLYGDALRAGIRVEQDYLVTSSGLRRLSHFPVALG